MRTKLIQSHLTLARVWSQAARQAKQRFDATPLTDPCKNARLYEWLNAVTARRICMQLAREVRDALSDAPNTVPVLPMSLAA